MSRVSTYLNFERQTEVAFNFYKSVFGTEFTAPIGRMGDVSDPNHPIAEADKNLVMNVQLPILGGHMLMGTDAPESMGFKLSAGNNVHIMLEPDTLPEAEQVFAALSVGGVIEMPLTKMFWGAHYGSFRDQFGIQWMVNCTSEG